MCGAIQRSSDTLESLKLCITRWEPSSSSSIYELLKDTKSPSFPQLAILHFEICSGDLEKSLNCTLPLAQPPFLMPPESDNIFTVLESSCIHLVDIYLKCICRPLLQYLLSYGSTLQPLAADFNNAISQHKSSLHTLSIRSSWDNGLAFGNNNKELLLLPLPALETLRVPVFVDSGWAQEGDAYLKLCLDRALNSAQFPLLRQLYLDPIVGKPEPVGSGDSGWARGNYITSLMDHAEALRRLCSYQFSSKSVGEAIREDPLPVVLTGGQRTYPIRTKEGWRYRSQTD
ncbi:hypothetical protein BKA70DRAFT_1272875 [Coprinopsis sp. MPI-PUGE-AT-0042]|nr:hypothetical protein BKA70DRAFT_1272875 [Coprinopsis sp. MPI-PUGE-AT-0042]